MPKRLTPEEMAICSELGITKIGWQAGERNARMFLSYFGILGFERRTLAQIGEAEGVTRERVRQIVGNLRRRLTRKPTALKRTASLKGRRSSQRFAKRRDQSGLYGVWVRGQPCTIAGLTFVHPRTGVTQVHVCQGDREAHHVKTRAAGGDDYGNMVSLCQAAHRLVHSLGAKTFDERFGVSLKDKAASLLAEYRQPFDNRPGLPEIERVAMDWSNRVTGLPKEET